MTEVIPMANWETMGSDELVKSPGQLIEETPNQ